ncbi:FAD-binding oxidoreductase [Sphingomonas hankyongi]|uniref:FAD-binding oxidoreductase n=1 Tax=Sphingomonas hankyongi TaxID=2908209 RepID=A0ABT0RZ00_9SPHN|nr:FAD-binding oxidoreductase [Sphingomonas hankyongi]MCL6728834.1 FAD-binding oxidoreductase [Sphingomonas hankyongi]
MSAQSQLIEQVRQRLGPRGVITDPAEIEPWVSDWRGRVHGASAAVLAPSSTVEVAEIVRLAAEHRVPLVPQGGNTGMAAGATPPSDGSALLLSLRRMNRIRSVSAEDRCAVAEAGVILATLHDAANEVGMRFPLTLGARGSCTLGGLTSTNAGGTQVLKFGTMRALVTGVEAVLPDGSVHDGLSGLKKDNRGYSLDQLLIGAEGTLGVVTAVAVRLVPAIAQRAVAWTGLDSPSRALDLLRFLEARTGTVEGFELVPQDSLDLVLKHIPGTRAPLTGEHRWHALVEATTPDAHVDIAAELEALLGKALQQGIIADAAIASNEAQAEAFWKIRDSISEAERAEGQTLAHDISVAVADMPRFLVEASAEVERAFPGVIASGFGHLGDGNIHFHVRAASHASPDWYEAEGAAITRLVDDLVTAAGGSISAEHGIGQLKRAELERLSSPARIHALRAIKQALDPLGIMNPGKLVP